MGQRQSKGNGASTPASGKPRLAEQISCCCFDLETTSLAADFGIVLCAVIKPAGGKAVVFRGDSYPAWGENRSNDSELVTDVVNELARYDIWVAHNGARFDVPYLRTRLMRWGLEPLVTRKLVDPVQLARNKLRLSFNGLSSVANHLGCNSKTDVEPQAWLRASLDGNSKAMDYIVQHCVEDVKTLEKVVTALKAYSTAYNSYGSGF